MGSSPEPTKRQLRFQPARLIARRPECVCPGQVGRPRAAGRASVPPPELLLDAAAQSRPDPMRERALSPSKAKPRLHPGLLRIWARSRRTCPDRRNSTGQQCVFRCKANQNSTLALVSSGARGHLLATADFTRHVHRTGALATKSSNSFATASCNSNSLRDPTRPAL